MFECQASALPRPEISWEYHNPVSMTAITITSDSLSYIITEVTDTNNKRLLMNTLTVLATDFADFGVYRCMATNVVAVARVDATLTIHSKGYSCKVVNTTMYCKSGQSIVFSTYENHITCMYYGYLQF